MYVHSKQQEEDLTDEPSQGYDVHAVDINDGDGLEALGCTTSKLDVTSEEDIQRFKREYGDGPLDVLLNVAGELTPRASCPGLFRKKGKTRRTLRG